jgi:hypothetical protein
LNYHDPESFRSTVPYCLSRQNQDGRLGESAARGGGSSPVPIVSVRPRRCPTAHNASPTGSLRLERPTHVCLRRERRLQVDHTGYPPTRLRRIGSHPAQLTVTDAGPECRLAFGAASEPSEMDRLRLSMLDQHWQLSNESRSLRGKSHRWRSTMVADGIKCAVYERGKPQSR